MDEHEFPPCPHCGGKIILKTEQRSYAKRFGKIVQYARIICENNQPFLMENRCLYKSIAAEINEVIRFAYRRKEEFEYVEAT